MSDMQYLRKGHGLTREKLAGRPRILDLCGTSDADTAYQTLSDTIDALLPNEDMKALKNALGVDYTSRGLLRDRRAAFADELGCSLDSVRDREDRAIAELILFLIGLQPVPDLPRPRFLMHRLFIKYLNRDRHFIQSEQYREVVALHSDLGSFRYGTDQGTNLINIAGGELQLDHVNEQGAMIHRIVFPTVLPQGGRHTFSFTEIKTEPLSTPREEIRYDWASQLFHMPARHFDVEVQYDGERPSVAWGFRQLSPLERPGQPHNDNRLTINRSGLVKATYQDLYGGFASGIAWRWNVFDP